MITLHQALERLRRDLGDTDTTNARWSNDDLERHLRHALRELSREVPREMKTTLTTTPSSRDVSVAGLTDVVEITAVEWPTGQYPPAYVRWSLWQTTLTLLVSGAPSAVENVNVYWQALHSLDPGGATLPEWAEDILADGAAGYAALEYATQSVNRVNTGDDVARHYQELATLKLGAFNAALARSGRRGALSTARLYVPSALRPTQSRDSGPP